MVPRSNERVFSLEGMRFLPFQGGAGGAGGAAPRPSAAGEPRGQKCRSRVLSGVLCRAPGMSEAGYKHEGSQMK